MKQVLFIGTPHMDIYRDVICEMERQGYSVDFIKERVLMEDPDNLRGYQGVRRRLRVKPTLFSRKNEQYWRALLDDERYAKAYDILFVLDGMGIHPVVFDILRGRNKYLYTVNYLFDTTRFVYRFEKNFPLFDKVATFDRADSEAYGIDLLPISYNAISSCPSPKFLFFGLGRYDALRYKLFSKMKTISDKAGRESFLKIHLDRVSHLRLKHIIKDMLGIPHFPTEVYASPLATHQTLLPAEFRNVIADSEVIVDTSPQLQDGLTARFMWALGAHRKIVTTNVNAKNYPFYTPAQIFIISDIDKFEANDQFLNFLSAPLELSAEVISEITKFRVDNWVKYLLQQN